MKNLFILILFLLAAACSSKENTNVNPKVEDKNCRILKMSYTYEKSNFLDSFSINIYNREYDNNKNLIKDVSQTDFLWAEEKKLYDLPSNLIYENNLLKKRILTGIGSEFLTDKTFFFSDTIIYEYNLNKKLSKETYKGLTRGTSNNYMFQIVKTYFYDAADKIEKITSREFGITSNKTFDIIFLNGKILKALYPDKNLVYNYITNEKGMILKKDSGNNNYFLYEYDKNNNITKYEEFRNGNLINKRVFSYDDKKSKMNLEFIPSGHTLPIYNFNIENYYTFSSLTMN
jgi:hypothetical protein